MRPTPRTAFPAHLFLRTALGLALLGGCAEPSFVRAAAAPSVVETPGRAVAVVRVPTPWYAPRWVVRGKFRDALAEYESNRAIEAKYFTISDAGEFGGLYLWSSRAEAESHFDAAWRAKVRERRGADADVLVLDSLLVVDGSASPIGEPLGRRSLAYDASATFVTSTVAEGELEARARALAAKLSTEDGLIRGFVVAGKGTVGAVALWATRGHADRATRGLTGTIRFEAPLLVDETLRRRPVAP